MTNFEINIKDSSNELANGALEIVFIINKNFEHRFVKVSKELFDKCNFKASQDEVLFLPQSDKLFVGLDSLSHEDVKTACATTIRKINTMGYEEVIVATYENIGVMAEGFILGAYNFERYKSKKESRALKSISIILDEYNEKIITKEEATQLLKRATIISEATNAVRDIVNTTPDDFYPEIMAQTAQNIATTYGLECDILEPEALKVEKMEALLAVARASRHTPRVIHLSHKPSNPKAKVILVGKGLTYDSGGLSLKPADYMVTMKADKSGGSAVLGIMSAVAQLKLEIEVHGFIGAVENMIGGDAYKPDDVLVAKNGKTIEVRNTDAEGRLVLADVLSLAQERVDGDYIFDMATLTGACVVAVGHYTSGVMGFNDSVRQMVIEGAKDSGELATKLDFNKHLAKTIKSEIADISNISSTRYGGAITAGLFLAEFIEEKNKDKWVHIDIAGPAFVEHSWGENPHGASGAGVRMMVKVIENLISKGN